MRSVLALSLIPTCALAAISINGPSSGAYWVQNTSNTISWSTSAGDPNPITIVVTNTQSATLNGEFSIAEYVNISQESVTITNVTLRPGSDYQVVFVNPANFSQVYANSTNFDVKPPGTAPSDASGSSPASSGTPASSVSSSGSSAPTSKASSTAPASSSSSGSATTGGNTTTTNNSSGAAAAAFGDVTGILFAVGACGLASLTALFL